ncbi:B3 domain-containing protein [Quillaja saponaria]|uniref:B3 domain-containing protein n=1 Tax=Quillaja saponaria TaxID=32244 RepID=A0AAD7QJK5_QUISA|nr:B3 domain-containing protein [Quillaja saponaria]
MSKFHRNRESSSISNSRALVAPARVPTFFFKIIFSYNIEEKKLRIPRKFVRDFGHELSAVATIKAPDGRIWKMSIENSEEDTWFRDGWHEFVNYYSIGVKYMVLFMYVGNSEFHVNMTDHQTCTQIHFHPYNNQSIHEEENDEEKIEEIIISDDEDNHDTSNRSKLNENVMSKPANPSFEVEFRRTYVHSVYVHAAFASKYLKTCKGKIKLQIDGKQWPASLYVSCSGKRIGSGWNDFARHNNLKIGDVCVFELINGEEVVLEVKINPENNQKTYNPLSQQDFGNKKPTTSAASQQSPRRKEKCKLAKKVETIELDNSDTSSGSKLKENVMSKPGNPSFEVKLGRTYNRYVYVRTAFASKYLPHKENIKLQVDGKQWPARLCPASSGKVILAGWADFVRDNNLKNGDVCVFEMISWKEVVLDVKVSPADNQTLKKRCNLLSQQNLDIQHYENDASKQYRGHERGFETGIKRVKRENQTEIVELDNSETSNVISKPHKLAKKNKKATRSCSSSKPRKMRVESARKCKHKNPSFRAVLSPSNIKGYSVYVPADFTAKYMNTCEDSIILELDGKRWPACCYFWNSGKRIGTGWAAFKNDINLKAGDVCDFELIKGKKSILRVAVTRGCS